MTILAVIFSTVPAPDLIPDVVGSHGQNQQGGVLEGRQMGLESIDGVVLESVCAVLVQRTENL